MPAAVVNLPGVELVRTGSWSASTGPVTVTPEHLAAMVSAAQDPEVDRGPIKIGHVGALSKDHLGDSAPAYGWLANHRIRQNEDGSQSLIGDLVDVPAKLASIMGKAFRRRSVEIAWNLKTPSGKTHPAVVTALALLGVQPPAVKGLADIADLYQVAASENESESESVIEFADSRNIATDAIDHGGNEREPGGVMPDGPGLAELRKTLGLPDDMSDTDTLGAAAGLAFKVAELESARSGGDALSADTIATLKEQGFTVIADSALSELQAGAAAGVAALAEQKRKRHAEILDTAERAGKFGAGEPAKTTRANFAALLDKDEAGTVAVLDGLPALVALSAIGNDDPGSTLGADVDIDKELAAFLGEPVEGS